MAWTFPAAGKEVDEMPSSVDAPDAKDLVCFDASVAVAYNKCLLMSLGPRGQGGILSFLEEYWRRASLEIQPMQVATVATTEAEQLGPFA